MDHRYLLFFLGALGAFNGLLLSVYFLSRSKKDNLAGLFLGGLLAALSLRIGKSVLVYFDGGLSKVYLQIGLSACLFIGPMLWMFLRAATERTAVIPKSWKAELSVLVALVICGLFVPYTRYPDLWNHYLIRFIYGVWLVYMIRSVTYLWGKLPALSNIRTYTVVQQWVLAIYAANLAVFISFFIALFFGKWYNTYYAGGLLFSFVLYGMVLRALYRGGEAWPFRPAPVKYQAKKLDSTNAQQLAAKLTLLMQTDAPYKKPDLTLPELAKMLGTPAHTLSQLLNDNLGKSFSAYINNLRIELACQMIIQGHPYSLEALGYEVGFNSKSSFYAAFKKITGTTPLSFEEKNAPMSA